MILKPDPDIFFSIIKHHHEKVIKIPKPETVRKYLKNDKLVKF